MHLVAHMYEKRESAPHVEGVAEVAGGRWLSVRCGFRPFAAFHHHLKNAAARPVVADIRASCSVLSGRNVGPADLTTLRGVKAQCLPFMFSMGWSRNNLSQQIN